MTRLAPFLLALAVLLPGAAKAQEGERLVPPTSQTVR
jgi:hypothetical protein